MWHFIEHARKKTTLIYKQGVKQTLTKENEGSFFNGYVEVTWLIQAWKIKFAYYCLPNASEF